MKKKLVVIHGLMLMSLLVLTGCFNGITIPIGDGNTMSIGGEEGAFSISVQGEDGLVELSGNEDGILFSSDEGSLQTYREIPDHFPSDVPTPKSDDVTAVGSFVTEVETEESNGFILSFKVEGDEKQKYIDMYMEYLESNNFEIEKSEEEYETIIVAAKKGKDVLNFHAFGGDDAVFTIQILENK
ncbi:hypothetical protein ACERII_14650 [Evansella sp. AB-rgal1]|uniref:hypothetical protein n=1 Tax=Evansella sp. AB-rgal1 TaxID=3242696 RepID=UPI00359E3DC2